MPVKEFLLDGVGTVKVYKRKGTRSLRLSIVGDGTIRVSQPKWLPYKAGMEFAVARKKWILTHRKAAPILVHGQPIGKSYQLAFIEDRAITRPTTRIRGNQVVVRIPDTLSTTDPVVQQAGRRAVDRALKQDAERLLVPRLRTLAITHNFSYRSVTIKRLRSRWGSCSHNKDIVLNSYLVQLPWHYIDYVILHELQHTTILAHGKQFWSALAIHVDNLQETRRAMKEFQAQIM